MANVDAVMFFSDECSIAVGQSAPSSSEDCGGAAMGELTPGMDGVMRDASGVPLYTPATVTVLRGARKASFRSGRVP